VTSTATADTIDARTVAPFPKIGASALLVTTVGDAEPELPEVEEDVVVAVSFEDVLDELVVTVAGEVGEEVTDAVPSLTIVVLAVPVVLADEEAALNESIPGPVILPTE
jgi:hypothetical protein